MFQNLKLKNEFSDFQRILIHALVEMKLTDFIDEVSRESPAPGGGSIAALAGAIRCFTFINGQQLNCK